MKLSLDEVVRTGEVRTPSKGEYYIYTYAGGQERVVTCGSTATACYPIVVPKPSKHFKVETTKVFTIGGRTYTEEQVRELVRDLQVALGGK